MGLRSRLRLLPATGRVFHSLLRPGAVILQVAVRSVKGKAVDLAGFESLEKEKGTRQVAAVSFAAHSWPGRGRSFAAGPSDSRTAPATVTADLLIGFDLSAAVGPGLVAAGSVVVVAAVVAGSADSVYSVCLVDSSAAATGRERAAVVSYFLARQSFS